MWLPVLWNFCAENICLLNHFQISLSEFYNSLHSQICVPLSLPPNPPECNPSITLCDNSGHSWFLVITSIVVPVVKSPVGFPVHKLSHTNTYTIQVFARARAHTHIHTYTRTYIQACIHKFVRAQHNQTHIPAHPRVRILLFLTAHL